MVNGINGINDWILPQGLLVGGWACEQLILDFMAAMYQDKASLDDGVSRAGVALLGDVASTLPSTGPLFAARPPVQEFVAECQSSEDPSVAQSAAWAAQAINTAIAA